MQRAPDVGAPRSRSRVSALRTWAAHSVRLLNALRVTIPLQRGERDKRERSRVYQPIDFREEERL